MTLTPYSDYQELFSGCILYLTGSLSSEIIGSHTITNSGVTIASPDRFGITNRAMTFNNNYLSFGNVADLKPTTSMTIIQWIKPSSTKTSAWGITFTCSYYGNFYDYNLHITYDTRYLAFESYTSDTGYKNTSNTNIIDLDTWQMITGTVTYSGGTIYIYKNATNVNYTSVNGTAAQIVYASNNVKLGNIDNNSDAHFVGDIGETMFFNRQLSAGEIKSIYNLTSKKYVYPLMDGKRGVY